MKITTICNPNSPYHTKQVKVLKYHPAEEQADVFLIDEELLLTLSLNDLAPEQETFKPKSRKDFYEFIQNNTTSRNQIVDTIRYLTKEGLLIINNPVTESDLIGLFTSHERLELVEEFRRLRDEGGIEFKLVNNVYTPQNNFKNKNSKPYRKPRY